MAEVFLAHRSGPQGFQKQLVIKRLLPSLSESKTHARLFLNEARLSALIDHPNVAHVSDFGEVDGQYYIAMEHVDGLTLLEVLQVAGPLGPGMASRIVIDVLDALQAIHDTKDLSGRALHLVHRDITPKNVMLTRGGTVKLIDFGIAISADDDRPVEAGTMNFMSPEQVRGDPLDHRSDLFCAGLLLMFLLTGRIDFRTPEGTLQARPEEVPESLWKIVERAVQVSVDARFSSARSFQTELEAFMPNCGAEGTKSHLSEFASFVVPPMTFMGRVFSEGSDAKPTPVLVEQTVGITEPIQETKALEETKALNTMPLDETVAMTALIPPAPQAVPQTEVEQALPTTRSPGLAWGSAAALLIASCGLLWALNRDPPELPAAGGAKLSVEAPPAKEASQTQTSKTVSDEVSSPATQEAARSAARRARSRRRARRARAKAASAKRRARAEAVLKKPGFLSIDSRPWTRVYIDGKARGPTPIARMELGAGTHTVRMRNPAQGIDKTFKVKIRPGKTVGLKKTFLE